MIKTSKTVSLYEATKTLDREYCSDIDALADLSDGSKLALSVAVVILNISCVLSFDTELKIFAALSKDTGDENSAYANGGKQTPWGAFRVFCLVICVAAALTQWMAING